MADLPVACITITRTLTDDGGDIINVHRDPEDLALVEALGLLRFAEDSLIRHAMGEEPDDEED